jgi:hypothetical protein
MNYEILSLETAEKLAKKSRRKRNKSLIKIDKAIKMLEYYVNYGENITLNGNALKPILAVLRGEDEYL